MRDPKQDDPEPPLLPVFVPACSECLPPEFDPALRSRLAAVAAYAEGHRIALATLQALAAGDPAATSAGDDPGHRLEIQGYRVVYSIEEQEPGPYRHLSVSCASGKLPGPGPMEAIAYEFLFPPLEECRLWFEQCRCCSALAVNLLAPLSAIPACCRGGREGLRP